MIPRIVAVVLFAIWAVLVAIGKGGFVHLLILSAVCVGLVDVISLYRSRMTANEPSAPVVTSNERM